MSRKPAIHWHVCPKCRKEYCCTDAECSGKDPCERCIREQFVLDTYNWQEPELELVLAGGKHE